MIVSVKTSAPDPNLARCQTWKDLWEATRDVNLHDVNDINLLMNADAHLYAEVTGLPLAEVLKRFAMWATGDGEYDDADNLVSGGCPYEKADAPKYRHTSSWDNGNTLKNFRFDFDEYEYDWKIIPNLTIETVARAIVKASDVDDEVCFEEDILLPYLLAEDLFHVLTKAGQLKAASALLQDAYKDMAQAWQQGRSKRGRG